MPKQNRDKMLTVRLTEEEYDLLQEEAEEKGMYVSELARERLTREAGETVDSQRTLWKLARESARRFLAIEDLPLEELWLYGSVARGEAGPDSDIDFLVVLEIERGERHDWLDLMYGEVMELEWEHETHISIQVFTHNMWEDQKGSSFREEVERDGIQFERRDGGEAIKKSAA